MATIFFHYLQVEMRIGNTLNIKKVILDIFKEEKQAVERVDYIFCTDKYLLKINKEFLAHNFYTDIITFSLNNQNKPIIGEIYISVDRIRENAKVFNVSLKKEVLRVIFHGALHLCGFDDVTSLGKNKMTAKENFYIRKFYVSRNTVSP